VHGLHLHYIQSHYHALATRAAEQQRSHLDYLEQLVEGEATMRENRSIERRIKNANRELPQIVGQITVSVWDCSNVSNCCHRTSASDWHSGRAPLGKL
jgi:hypothetical protein